MVGRDELDGFHLDMTKVEGYLKKLVLWVRILIMTILVLSLVSIAVWNFFAPAHKDVSDRVIDKLIGALNSENIAALVGGSSVLGDNHSLREWKCRSLTSWKRQRKRTPLRKD